MIDSKKNLATQPQHNHNTTTTPPMAEMFVGALHEPGQSIEQWAQSTVASLEQHPSGTIVPPNEHPLTYGWAEARHMEVDLKSRNMNVFNETSTLPTEELKEFSHKLPMRVQQAMLYADLCVEIGFASRLSAVREAMKDKMHILDFEYRHKWYLNHIDSEADGSPMLA